MPHPPDSANALDAYRKKRSADRTTEPFESGVPEIAGTGLFMIHKHAARNLHYDLRLEIGGTLRSWAVPRGPSMDPREKRFAVAVEDHPLPYADFEGVIPQGNYGAGPSIVWDRGQWVPHGDPVESIRSGKLLFTLKGYKVRGLWALVKTKQGPTDWLLIKEHDGFASSDPVPFREESVLSGLTVEEVGAGVSRSQTVKAELLEHGALAHPLAMKDVTVMLAQTADEAFSSPDWLFELKYDGYRLLVGKENGTARLLYRSGGDATPFFPEVASAVAGLPYDSFILDGEVVIVGEDGRPSFQDLQGRGQLGRRPDIARASIERPATLYLFDLLSFEGLDARALPLRIRKAILQKLLPPAGALRFLDHIDERGKELFEEVKRLDLEGVVAKKAASRYQAGRSPDWLKIKVESTADLAVVGFTAAKSGRVGFGGLYLACFENGQYVFAGRVGSGFTAAELAAIRKTLEKNEVPEPPCVGPIPREKGHTWVTPRLVCEIRYREVTRDGLLRHPIFLRFREDKRPQDCGPVGKETAEEPEAAPAIAADSRTVEWTRREKVFWPADGYTKGDLLDYYQAIAPWLLAYLVDRPLVLTRFPDGIEGKSFFQQDAPAFVPDWIRTVKMWSEHASREVSYFVADEPASLLYLTNLGTIPLHIWSSRVKTLQQPDWCILDLDPKGAPFADVVTVALALRKLGEELGIPTFVKTSGSTGIHVLVPLGRQLTYEQSRVLGELLARIVVLELPEIATVERVIANRGGRVYVDFGQNGHGKLLVAPFSVRPLPGAPVSAPLLWDEVNGGLTMQAYTIKTMPRRMEELKDDPLVPVLTTKADLFRALATLGERFTALSG